MKYTIKDLYKNAGKKLTEKMVKVFGDEKKAIEWFYLLNRTTGIRPYDLCKEKNFSELEKILGRMEHGIIS